MDKDSEAKTDKKGRIKLDETLKLLFSVSKPLVVNIVNYFFNENFNVNGNYDVEFMATESTDLNIELRRADFIVKIGKINSFHFEFQLNGDKYMVLRMFEYGYREARKETDEGGVPVIYFPKQAVLYLEEGKGVPDELKLRIKFPVTDRGEQEIVYKVVVKKVWEIGKEEKINKGLYSLLPLEIFKLRKKIEKVKTADEEEFLRLSKRIRTDTIDIIDIASKLKDERKISEGDYTKIIEAIKYLLEYFSENYADLKLSKEVSQVEEYIYTRGKNEGKREGINEGKRAEKLEIAAEMLKKGSNVEFVSGVTKLPKEEVIKLQEEINNKHSN